MRPTSSHLEQTGFVHERFFIHMAFHTFMSLRAFTLVFASICCKMYSRNSSTFLFSLFSFSLTLSVLLCSSSIQTEKSHKILSLPQKLFWEFCATSWTSMKFYSGNETSNREQAVWLHLAKMGSQSAACHIITFFSGCKNLPAVFSDDLGTRMELWLTWKSNFYVSMLHYELNLKKRIDTQNQKQRLV